MALAKPNNLTKFFSVKGVLTGLFFTGVVALIVKAEKNINDLNNAAGRHFATQGDVQSLAGKHSEFLYDGKIYQAQITKLTTTQDNSGTELCANFTLSRDGAIVNETGRSRRRIVADSDRYICFTPP